jgi:hypothetical protein
MVIIDLAVLSEYGILIRCDIGPRSVERSRDDRILNICNLLSFIISITYPFAPQLNEGCSKLRILF